MKIAVVGLGSMGKRRVRLIKLYCQNNHLDDWSIIGVDVDRQRQIEASREFSIETCGDLADAFSQCDAVVISTSPLSHASIIEKALMAGKHVFTEINLVQDGYERNIALAEQTGKILFLSSTFLYREETRYLTEAVSGLHSGTYRYHVGQYLPDWHPWEDYRSFFVANERTDACRELFAIELPWLLNAFGSVANMHVVHRKTSRLNLPYDDDYTIIFEHESGIVGNLQLDVVCRKAVRNFEFSSEDAYITWDGTATGLCRLKFESGIMEPVDLYRGDAEHQDGYAAFVVENAYYNEIDGFFKAVRNGVRPVYGFKEDLETLRLIDQIEGVR